jgi:hypothetical protein
MAPIKNWTFHQPAREWYHPALLRQCRASRHRHSERRGYTGTTCSQSRRKHTTKSVSRWMMPRRRTGVWTNPQANGADECLPLLSDRERQRLIGGPVALSADGNTAIVGGAADDLSTGAGWVTQPPWLRGPDGIRPSATARTRPGRSSCPDLDNFSIPCRLAENASAGASPGRRLSINSISAAPAR